MANSKIYLGNTNIGSLFQGASDISIYLGENKVYPLGGPLKYSANLSNGNTFTIYCNDNSALTSGETWQNSTRQTTTTAATVGNCVRRLRENVFRYFQNMISVDIPSTVTSFSSSSFEGCHKLKTINIPSGITEIPTNCFIQCYKLNNIIIPSGVTSIGYSAFQGCYSLTSINIPSGVTSIGNGAFLSCSGLTSIDIPDSVTSIGQSAFQDCSSLTSITVNSTIPPTLGGDTPHQFNGSTCPIYVPCESVEAYKSASGWSTYASRITCAQPPVSTCYEIISTPITSYTPSEYGSVYSFADSKWYMKNNLDNMEEYGVYDIVNDISTATTYEGKLSVVGETEYQYSGGSWSVVGTYVSTEVTYTIDRTSPSPYVGQELSTTFKIPYADFNNVNLTIKDNNGGDLVISSSFFFKTYKYQSYNGTVTNDGKYYYLSLPSEAPQSIVISSVSYTSSTPIHIIFSSEQITVKYAEKATPSYAIYDTVAEMESAGCPNVGINEYAFVGNDLYKYFANEEWDGVSYHNPKMIAFYENGDPLIVYNNGNLTLEEYERKIRDASPVSVYIGDSVTSIGNDAFYGCSGLTSIDIPSGITSIGERTFSRCYSLTSIAIPSGVTSIGKGAFEYCRNLTSIDIPSGVTSISERAFSSCDSLTSIAIPSGVTSIGSYAFYGCDGLTSIDIPNNVTSIGEDAFRDCSGLTNVTIGDGITSIGNYAFSRCTSLTSINIPSGVTSIGQQAFSNCSSLTSATVKATTPPTLANANAFTNTNNCPIYVPASSVDAYKSATNWSTYASRIQAIP